MSSSNGGIYKQRRTKTQFPNDRTSRSKKTPNIPDRQRGTQRFCCNYVCAFQRRALQTNAKPETTRALYAISRRRSAPIANTAAVCVLCCNQHQKRKLRWQILANERGNCASSFSATHSVCKLSNSPDETIKRSRISRAARQQTSRSV